MVMKMLRPKRRHLVSPTVQYFLGKMLDRFRTSIRAGRQARQVGADLQILRANHTD